MWWSSMPGASTEAKVATPRIGTWLGHWRGTREGLTGLEMGFASPPAQETLSCSSFCC